MRNRGDVLTGLQQAGGKKKLKTRGTENRKAQLVSHYHSRLGAKLRG